MLDHETLAIKLLIAQKQLIQQIIYIQSELYVLPMTERGLLLIGDTGEISGSMIGEIITGSSLKTDKILGGVMIF